VLFLDAVGFWWMGIVPESLDRVKHRLRQITKPNRGISLARMIAEVNAFLSEWLTYFRYAQRKTHLQRLDA
jgi:RNA-directed DNA polymerase